MSNIEISCIEEHETSEFTSFIVDYDNISCRCALSYSYFGTEEIGDYMPELRYGVYNMLDAFGEYELSMWCEEPYIAEHMTALAMSNDQYEDIMPEDYILDMSDGAMYSREQLKDISCFDEPYFVGTGSFEHMAKIFFADWVLALRIS